MPQPIRKLRNYYNLNPKSWKCTKTRLAHVVTHAYYRQPFFIQQKIVDYLKKGLSESAKKWNINLIISGCDYTHCHILIKQQPKENLSRQVNLLKGASSRALRKEFEYSKKYPKFWADSFFVTFYRPDQISIPYNYIRDQLREKNERT